eukprot:g4948.t1
MSSSLWEWANRDSDTDDSEHEAEEAVSSMWDLMRSMSVGPSLKDFHAGPPTQLHLAAEVGSAQTIHHLLSRGLFDVNHGNPEGCTPLIVAAARGHTDAVRTLIMNQASLSAVEHKGANALHASSQQGRLDATRLLIRHGSDLEAKTKFGYTCLHMAASRGQAHVMKVLVEAGANIESREHEGRTPLHVGAEGGHANVCKLLAEAGADLEAAHGDQYTALHSSAYLGHEDVMKVLIEAGENLNSRLLDGRTPLHECCIRGHMGAVRLLLRAGADPLLTNRTTPINTYVPLDTAVRHGQLEVVRELIGYFGLEGCAGVSGGTEALRLAAQNNHLDIMALLAEEGVEGEATALVGAVAFGNEMPVKILLQLRERAGRSTERYVNTLAMLGERLTGPPLLVAIGFARHRPLPRIVRMLVEAGADTKSVVATRPSEPRGTPLDFVARFIREKKVDGEKATEDQLHKLEAIRRLLLTVDAVHATSWLWQKNVPPLGDAAKKKKRRKAKTSLTELRTMLPALRRRAGKRGLTPETAFRFSRKL